MSRQDSLGAQSTRTTHSSVANTYDQARPVMMYQTLSQMSYQMSAIGSDESVRSNSPDYTTTAQLESQNFDAFTYHGADLNNDHKTCHRDSSTSMQSNGLTDTSYSAGLHSEDAYMSTYIPGQGFNSKDSLFFNDSPTLLGDEFLDFPQDAPVLADDWVLPSQMMSPTVYSPSEDSLSSAAYTHESPEVTRSTVRSTKKTGPRQSKVNSDIARNSRPSGNTETLNDPLKYTTRTQENDNNARVHELYHNAAPAEDGLYHCPWEGKESCQHKPEKLKCNYE